MMPLLRWFRRAHQPRHRLENQLLEMPPLCAVLFPRRHFTLYMGKERLRSRTSNTSLGTTAPGHTSSSGYCEASSSYVSILFLIAILLASRFSAIFVCPISCEVFLAGRYGSSYEENGSIIWYSKKSLAEHAAAARAYDCFILREGDMTTLQQRKQLGRDQPYHERSEEPLPREIPRFVISAVESMKSLMVTQHPQEIRLGGQDVSTNKVPNIFQPTVKRNKASSEHPT